MGEYRFPEYTQEEINMVLAKRILNQDLTEYEQDMLVNIPTDDYILLSKEDIGR